MESHPKVMTVSYGTFACTLEGFDDPFTTMQLVAEYFRKLSAEDRYFGGEPLQPDANIIHRIAKDANPYKVDAEETEGGLTLRKADVVDAPDPVQAEPETPAAQDNTAAEGVTAVEDPAPLFTSQRVVAEPLPVFERSNTKDEAETGPEPEAMPEPEQEEDDDTFVAAAMFSSRRVDLTAAPNEPDMPAAELLAEENDSEEDAVEEFETPNVDPADLAPVDHLEEDLPPAAEHDEPLIQDADDVPAAEETLAVEEADIAASIAAAMPKTAVVERAPAQTDEDIQKEEEALERLLETTNTKLDTPETARKSNALERLKAAVAATEAERRLRTGVSSRGRTERPKPVDTAVDAAEFRKKITEARESEDVVSFSRPSTKSKTERPRGNFKTLILGLDQRVQPDAEGAAEPQAKKLEDPAADMSPPADEQKPARKIRILRPNHTDDPEPIDGWEDVSDDNVQDDVSSKNEGAFAKFAEKLGAASLYELMEASAAYLSLVEDEPRYSQNRIVSNISDYLAENAVSEDQMTRSFNRMMRDGRLLRVKSDRYTLSKSARSGFRDRLAG
ncbi:MAG: hypothetical protein AAF393_07050 [Pseudomonadota bacterium]